MGFVQEIDQVGFSNTGHTELILAVPPAGVEAGHSIIVAVEVTLNTGDVSVTDSAGNDYTLDLLVSDGHRLLIFSAHQVEALEAGDEITVSFDEIFLSVEVLYSSAVALEYSRIVSADQLDQTADHTGTGTSLSSGTTGATDRANEVAVAFFTTDGDLGEFTAGAGWTARTGATSYTPGVGGHTLYPADQSLTAAGTQEATGTLSQSRTYVAGIVTYRSTTMADPVGNLGKVGIGIEGTPGTPVDAQVLLDVVSENIRGEGAPIRSKAINGTRMVKKVVAGPYQWGGDLQLEVTPDKVSKLLYAALSSLATVGTANPYTHTLKTGNTLKPLTVHVYRPGPDGSSEPCYFVYPGGYIESIEFRQSAEEILMATVTLRGRAGERIYDAAQEDGGIAFSSLDPFTFNQLAVSIAASAREITSNWSLRLNTGLIIRRNLAGGRVPNRAFAGDSLISGSFEMVFEDISEHRLFMGATADTSPIAIGTAVNTQALSLAWTATAQRKLTLGCGSMYYRASGPALAGRDQTIVQPIEWEALYNASDASDIVATIINAESGANITGAGTDI